MLWMVFYIFWRKKRPGTSTLTIIYIFIYKEKNRAFQSFVQFLFFIYFYMIILINFYLTIISNCLKYFFFFFNVFIHENIETKRNACIVLRIYNFNCFAINIYYFITHIVIISFEVCKPNLKIIVAREKKIHEDHYK